MYLYIFPNHLFSFDIIKNVIEKNDISEIILWEHPDFFSKYNFNKKKLILHRSSMKAYENLLNRHTNVPILYIEFHKKHKMKKSKSIMFDPINNIKSVTTNIIESPNFFLSKNDYFAIKANKKSIRFTTYFYPRCKKKFKFLEDIASKDKYNRENLKDDVVIPSLIQINKNKYIEEAITYVNNHFDNNYGNVCNFNYPITHDQAKEWLLHFIKYKLESFGKYQDAIWKDNNTLFHSVLSSSINIGLLNPIDIIDSLRSVKITKKNINSVEGFVRQLCWREYQRFCYIHYNHIANKNYFNFKKRITKQWYDGTTNIIPVNDCIRKAFDTGYLHHIERLMIIGNFMTLSEINPKQGFKWFMEFAIDSYEWVMMQNVYDMVFFCSNGLTTHKPYITSSNYILKMSNYSSKYKWDEIWDLKYENFKIKFKNKLWKYRYHFQGLK